MTFYSITKLYSSSTTEGKRDEYDRFGKDRTRHPGKQKPAAIITFVSLALIVFSPVTLILLFSLLYTLFSHSFSFSVALYSPDHINVIFQVPPVQALHHQISQDSPSHSAAQMRCSESSLVVRIPSPAYLVSYTSLYLQQLESILKFCVVKNEMFFQLHQGDVWGKLTNKVMAVFFICNFCQSYFKYTHLDTCFFFEILLIYPFPLIHLCCNN